MENILRVFWRKIFNFNWKFGLFLILIICIPRFIIVLNANVTRNSAYIGLIMFVSAIIPFIFLNKNGRRQIGICKPKKYHWLLYAFVVGLVVSILLGFLGETLFRNSFENWYKYIGKAYNVTVLNPQAKLVSFVIVALISMTFSPIGEELFFRGIVHSSFSKSTSSVRASIIDSSAFALTHIAHFGLVFINNKWKFFIVPALIWVLSMFFVSILFFFFKKKSGSLLGAMICHSAFNLGMTFYIFYL